MAHDTDRPTGSTLRGTISIVVAAQMCNIEGDGLAVLHKGIALPAVASVGVHGSKPGQPTKDVHLFVGESQRTGSNLFLGRFPLEQGPNPPTDPGEIEIEVGISAVEVVAISAVGPAPIRQRVIGLVDMSKAAIPPTVLPALPFSTQGLFSEFFGTDSANAPRPRPGIDISLTIKLDANEATAGTNAHIQAPAYLPCAVCNATGLEPNHALDACPTCGGTGVLRRVGTTDTGAMISACPCPDCEGTGQQETSRCHACSGHGSTQTTSPILVSIPANVQTGTVVCLLGQGRPGIHGGREGHLYVRLEIDQAG